MSEILFFLILIAIAFYLKVHIYVILALFSVVLLVNIFDLNKHILAFFLILISLYAYSHIHKKYGIEAVEKIKNKVFLVALPIICVAFATLEQADKQFYIVFCLCLLAGFAPWAMATRFMYDKLEYENDEKGQKMPFSYFSYLMFWVNMQQIFILAGLSKICGIWFLSK